MIIFKQVADIQAYLAGKRKEGLNIGFVPTMGALHEGHITLLQQAKTGSSLTVASIFVNPTQFNDKEDFKNYPISVEQDVRMLTEAGCDVLFLPQVEEMYPGGEAKMPVFEFGYLESVLEGSHRPGHFKGVGQVVARLLDIVKPDKLFMGQKDYQQCMVIKKLLSLLDSHIELVICPTMREPDGLAMSSRNRRLTEPQRAVAGLIYQCLVSIQAKKELGEFEVVRMECADLMQAKGLTPEYIALADADTLELLDDYHGDRNMVALIAVKLGNIRLIDNMVLG